MSWYELAAVVLVDRAGRILLQLRDSDAPNWPDQWGLPGTREVLATFFDSAAYTALTSP